MTDVGLHSRVRLEMFNNVTLPSELFITRFALEHLYEPARFFVDLLKL